MAVKRIYLNWKKDLDVWRDKLRHLKWLSDYRLNIIRQHIDLKGKKVLDIGSGPQFTADLMKELGAEVITLDKYAPCDLCSDINSDFTACLESGDFDLIVMGAVIRYIKDKKVFFQRAEKILKPGGIIFIDEFVHNMMNDAFLEGMVQIGAMEQWPKENFTPLEELESIISKTKKLKNDSIYSCWPYIFLKGKYPLPVWYSLILKKTK